MSATFHTLGTLQIPRGMVWADEHNWLPVEKDMEYSLTGALLVDAAVRQAGRPITLQADDNAGWIERGVLQDLRALASVPDATYLFTHADGREFTVMFSPDDPLQAVPVGRPELPADTNPYIATVRLIEVSP
jgi:hypothetical protein